MVERLSETERVTEANVHLSITEDDALVLFEWLHRVGDAEGRLA